MPNRPAGAPPLRVARIITRLNIGGPSIQAARLTPALDAAGYHTRLIHGRLGPGEGDMRYLLSPEADVLSVPTLCRQVSLLDDLRTLVRLYLEIRRERPALVHTHMAKAGLLGRLAAAAYNLTAGRDGEGPHRPHVPRARARGLLQPGSHARARHARARARARERRAHRDLAGHPRGAGRRVRNRA
jgi:hypothetical protein